MRHHAALKSRKVTELVVLSADLDDTLLQTSEVDTLALEEVATKLKETHPQVSWEDLHQAWAAAFKQSPWDTTHEATLRPRSHKLVIGKVSYVWMQWQCLAKIMISPAAAKWRTHCKSAGRAANQAVRQILSGTGGAVVGLSLPGVPICSMRCAAQQT